MADKKEFTLDELRGFFKEAKERERIEEFERRVHPLTKYADYLVALRYLSMRHRDIHAMLVKTGVLGKGGEIGKKVVKDADALARVIYKLKSDGQVNEAAAKQIAKDIASSPELKEFVTSPMALVKEIARITQKTPEAEEIGRIKNYFEANKHLTLTDLSTGYINATLNGV